MQGVGCGVSSDNVDDIGEGERKCDCTALRGADGFS